MDEPGTSALETRKRLDREVELVSTAVALVASGAALATTVAGLRLTEQVIEIVGPEAARQGVTVEPIWGPDETSNDVRVRRDEATR